MYSKAALPAATLLPLLLLLISGASCGQFSRSESKPRPAVERVAILPFDNQSGDESGNALGAQVARLAALALTGSTNAFVFAVPSRAEPPLRRATQIVTGYFTRRSGGGEWQLHGQVRDMMAAPRLLRSFEVSGAQPGVLADGVAAQLGKPGFAVAQKDLAALETAMGGQGAPAAAAESVVKALQLGAAAEAMLMPLPGETNARLAALTRRSQLTPADSETAYAIGLALQQAGEAKPAVEALRRAAQADPEWADIYNQTAFAEAFVGNEQAALAAIEAYRKLDKTANPSDSLGEVSCLLGRFDDAERAFLSAYDKDPAFYGGVTLRKAAEARRMAGNGPEADKLFARYAEAHAKQPLIELERAQWDYTSGRKKEALAAAEAFAAKSNSSLAWTQVAAWRAVENGDAMAAAREALKTARTGAEQQSAVVALFMAQPDVSAAEWQARAAKQFPPNAAALARYALVHALTLRKHWAEAIPLLTELRRSVHPAQASHWQSLLAIALAESGQAGRAKAEARFWPIPRTLGEATWEFLVFPRIVELIKRGS